MNIQTLGIIGLGRFGILIKDLAEKHAAGITLFTYDTKDADSLNNLEFILKCDLIIPAVPISELESVVDKLSGRLNPKQIILDVSSVKLYSHKVFSKIKSETQVILSHPMFGPATLAKQKSDNPLSGLNINLENLSATQENYAKVKEYLLAKKFKVNEFPADLHDKLTAGFQFTSILTALCLKNLELKTSPIDTESFKALLAFQELISVDQGLLRDLYKYNPYCQDAFKGFENAFDSIKKYITI